MNQSKNTHYLVAISILYTTLLYVKYFFQNWDSNESVIIDFIANSVSAISLFFCAISVYISNNKERVFFIIITIFFTLSLLLYSNVYYFWSFISYTLIIFYSRINNKAVVSILLLSFLFAWLIFLPFELFYSSSMFYNDDRYTRLSLGFKNPNTLALILFILYTLFLCRISYFHNNKLKYILFFTISLATFVLLYYTMSRTFIFVSILASLFFMLQNHEAVIPRKKLYLLTLILVVSLQLLSIFTYSNYNSNIAILDTVLSGRIWFSYIMYSSLGLPNLFLGTNIQDYLPIDFFFINILFSSGWLFSALFLSFIFYLSNSLTRVKSIFAAIAFLMLLISSTENIFNTMILNYSLLLLYKK